MKKDQPFGSAQLKRRRKVVQKNICPRYPPIYPTAPLQKFRSVLLEAFQQLPVLIYPFPDASAAVRLGAEPHDTGQRVFVAVPEHFKNPHRLY